MKSCFIRGSVIRYINISPENVDFPALEDVNKIINITGLQKDIFQ